MKRLLTILFATFAFILNVSAKQNVLFSKCIDGDTAIFTSNDEKIKARFIAIDTPEISHGDNVSEPYADEASIFTCEKITNANKIELEFEKNKYDKYGRTLAWVWVDNTLLQEELVKEGYAKVQYLYDKYKYSELLQKEERIAKENNIRIWSDYVFKEYHITFEYNGEKLVQNIKENDKATYFTPIKKGYKFIGWYYNNDLYNFDNPVTKDLILIAKFEKNNYLNILLIFSIIIYIILKVLPLNIRKKGKKK